ncbi:MAG: 50S ribosomal protein L17 [Ignavibacteria bacterium]|nr:50S ribosomal protein L17 [Ignavibacteria bacterium]
MRHLKSGWKLKRTSSHRLALLRNLATALLEHKRIQTTLAKAKALRPFVEKLITRAKNALYKEKNNLLPAGQKVDIHSRRLVAKHIKSKAVVQELFDTIAPVVSERPGGYTRIVKLGVRRGDSAEVALIELVDWGAPQDGAISKKGKKTTATKSKGKVRSKVAKKKTEAKVETALSHETLQTEPGEKQQEVVSSTKDVSNVVISEALAEAQQTNVEEGKVESLPESEQIGTSNSTDDKLQKDAGSESSSNLEESKSI